MTKFRKSKIHKIIIVATAIFLGASAATCSYSQILNTPDEYITNYILTYNPFQTADERITIVAIDSSSEETYGVYNSWSRSKLADAVTILNNNNASVIALDNDLSSEKDQDGDAALVAACKEAGNVIVSATVKYDSKTNDSNKDGADVPSTEMQLANPADSSMNWNEHVAESLLLPYEDLLEVVSYGVSNATQQSRDGSIRSAAININYQNQEIDSFAIKIYKAYQDSMGLEYTLPNLDSQELFGFSTIFSVDSYRVISYSDLIDGNFDKSQIDGNIVILGQYDNSELDNQYFKNVRSDAFKQDVLIQTSILQALITERAVRNFPDIYRALIYGLIIAIVFLIGSKLRFPGLIILHSTALVSVVLLASHVNQHGYRFLLLVPIAFLFLSIIFKLIDSLAISTIEKKQMERTLTMYVDKQVVDQISELAPFALGTVSERRNIAVLFVDIRNFTTMSEEFDPAEVVAVLNKYFAVIYASITAWNGTIDKFIGDAAMALFNAPNESEHYIENAVCAADDIMKGFLDVKTSFKEKYDRDIDIGIGIHTGEAIVGNIGCLGRMDYTAIGDAVNTASRLESKAKPGQILISEAVYSASKELVEVTDVGLMELKGKTKAVQAYQIDNINKPTPPNEKARKEYLHEINLLHSKNRPD